MKTKPFGIGDVFVYKYTKRRYLLAQTDASVVALIGLTSGNRFWDPHKVSNIYNITHEEFHEITGGSFVERFKRIKTRRGDE